tara:strand:+ start:222 stop:413 length:192 start_codon:yes stop_codon:yes gene_type:complete
MKILNNGILVCDCKDDDNGEFDPCDTTGKIVEPDENWKNLYKCLNCNAIILVNFRRGIAIRIP